MNDTLRYRIYHQVLKGVSQRMDSYQCTICGHVYEPGKGEPSMNIPGGTDFRDLPGDWRCPVCQATPDKFTRI